MNEGTLVDARKRPRTIRFEPFGVHTRYMLGSYLRHTLMVAFALLAIALTIDLWPQIHLITEGDRNVLVSVWEVARFCVLRTPDLLSPLVPFAIFLGVVWAEIALTQSGERMLVWNSGRSPAQCLAPAVALGLIVGFFQFAMDGFLGPWAMQAQMHERLGLDGRRLDRSRTAASHWIASADGLVRTEIAYGPPPTLRNMTLYKLDEQGRLIEVDSAASASPMPGENQWLMRNGRFWVAKTPADAREPARTAITFGDLREETLKPFKERTAVLRLSPIWLTDLGIEPQYITLPELHTLAHAKTNPLARARYQTRVQAIYAAAFFPGLMAVLAALLSMLAFAYATPPRALIGILLAGYLAHFGNKAGLLLGQNGYLDATPAAWLTPIIVLAGILLVLRIATARRRRAIDSEPKRVIVTADGTVLNSG